MNKSIMFARASRDSTCFLLKLNLPTHPYSKVIFFWLYMNVVLVNIIYEAFFQSAAPSCASNESFGKEDNV